MQRIGRRIASTAFVAAALLQPALAEPPKFQVDPSWPLPLPSNWIIGTIGGITVDAQDHIWINQRPSSLDAREKRASTASNVKCCVPAPPVIEFDQAGKVVQGWGGDGPGYKWGNDGHGIHVDHNNFVWVGDNVDTGGHIFKFTRDGKFVMRIGQPGTPTGSNDTAHLGRPADMVVDPRDQRAVRRRRLRQSARHRVRCRDRRLQAALGRLRQTADRREDHLGSEGACRRSSSAIRCTASPSPTTGWCWSATAATTACRCSARTGRSCAKSWCSRRARPARSARS